MNTGHEHEHCHDHDHPHEHTHDHEHCHDHEHSHEHTHEHSHEHTHTHSHEHTHTHTHEHDHEHGHTHSHDHGHTHSHTGEFSPREELVAMLNYMVGHNMAHAESLVELAGKVRDMGEESAYDEILRAVKGYEEGNRILAQALEKLK